VSTPQSSTDTAADDVVVDVPADAPADADTGTVLPDPDPVDADAVVEPVDVVETDEDSDDSDDEDDDEVDDLLVQEGDVAGDYLERLLDILDVDGDIDLDVEGDRASVAVVGGELRTLIGPDGATLEALQELTRLAVAQSTGTRSRLMLDIGGFRAKRRADLTELAGQAASRVAASGTSERLAPMNPFERKVVHDVIAAAEGVRSESEGEEPNRRVVVLPAS
ncbi:Jag protein with KH domain and RH3 domain, partial [Klenkia terrae]